MVVKILGPLLFLTRQKNLVGPPLAPQLKPSLSVLFADVDCIFVVLLLRAT